MLWLTIACRNMFRNRRRSVFTILAIGIGFAGVTLFSGFVHYIFSGLRDLQIYGLAEGHLLVFKEGWARSGASEEEASFSQAQMEIIDREIAREPAVITTTPGMMMTAMLSNGRNSTMCYAYGISPSGVLRIRSMARGLLGDFKYYRGKALSDDVPFGIGVGEGLLHALDLQLGDTVVLAGPTADGQYNAVDCEVVQVFETGGDRTDRSLLIPIEYMGRLRNARSAHRVGVLLRDGAKMFDVRDRLRQRLAAAGCPVEIYTWEETSQFYRRVRDMFKVISRFNLIIVLIVAGMSVINTIGMAVMERTREIGTLRALGLKPAGIRLLFALESGMIGLCGTALGIVLTLAGWLTMEIVAPKWTPPQINVEVPLQIHLVPDYIVMCSVIILALAVLAALLASRRATTMKVVEALGHT